MNQIWLNAVRASAGAVAPAAPLDGLLTSPVGVFALYRLLSSYSGALVRVRRGSDDAEQDFSDVSQVAAWLGAATGYVRTLYDQSGAGNNATQTTTGEQPTIITSGTYALAFDGTQWMSTVLQPAQNQTWTTLLRFSDIARSFAVIRDFCGTQSVSASYGYRLTYRSTDRLSWRYGGAVEVFINPNAGVIGNRGNRAYFDGTDRGAIPDGTPEAYRGILLGARNIGVAADTPAARMVGRIQSYVAMSSTLSDAEYAAVSAAMAAL